MATSVTSASPDNRFELFSPEDVTEDAAPQTPTLELFGPEDVTEPGPQKFELIPLEEENTLGNVVKRGAQLAGQTFGTGLQAGIGQIMADITDTGTTWETRTRNLAESEQPAIATRKQPSPLAQAISKMLEDPETPAAIGGRPVYSYFSPNRETTKLEDFHARMADLAATPLIKPLPDDILSVSGFGRTAAGAIVQSGLEMAPGAALLTAAPFTGPAAPLVAGAGMTAMAAPWFARTYLESRKERNRTPSQALMDATVLTGVEFITQKRVLDGVWKPAATAMARVKRTAGEEALQETFTEAFNIAYESGVFGDEFDAAESAARLAIAGIAGGTMGGVLGATSQGIYTPYTQRKVQAGYDRLVGNINTAMADLSDRPSNMLPHQQNFDLFATKTQNNYFLSKLKMDILLDAERQYAASGVEMPAKERQKLDATIAETAALADKVREDQKALSAYLKDPQPRVDVSGQLTLPGFSLQKTATLDDLIQVQPQPMNVPEQQLSVENTVLLGKYISQVSEKSAGYIHRLRTALDIVPKNAKAAMVSWVSGNNPEGLIKASEILYNNQVYRAKVKEALDYMYPDSDYVVAFVGHDAGTTPFHEVEGQQFVRASLNPSIAAGFAHSKQPVKGQEDTGGVISVLRVPKKAVIWGNGTPHFEDELEIVLDSTDKDVTSYGFFGKNLQSVWDKPIPLTGLHSTTNLQNVPVSIKKSNADGWTKYSFHQPLQQTLPGFYPQGMTAPGPMDVFPQSEPTLTPPETLVSDLESEYEAEMQASKNEWLDSAQANRKTVEDAKELPEALWDNLSGEAPEGKTIAGAPLASTLTPASNTQQLGSNPGGTWVDANGVEYYVKFPTAASTEEAYKIALNEVRAAQLYRLLGVRVPDVYMLNIYGQPAVVSKMEKGLEAIGKSTWEILVDPATTLYQQKYGLEENFVIDAWLANWDVAGLTFDNIFARKVTPEGDIEIVRLDTGGALEYRAQGQPKGELFGEEVTELDTLRDPNINPQSATLFKHITEEDIADSEGLQRLRDMDAAKLWSIIAQGQHMLNSSADNYHENLELFHKLLMRREYILKRYGKWDVKVAASASKSQELELALLSSKAYHLGNSVTADERPVDVSIEPEVGKLTTLFEGDAAGTMEMFGGRTQVQEMVAVFQELISRFAGDSKIILKFSAGNASVPPGLHVGHPDLTIIRLNVPPGHPPMSPLEAFTIFSHELGHEIGYRYYAKAPRAVKRAIREAHLIWYNSRDGATIKDYIRNSGNLYDVAAWDQDELGLPIEAMYTEKYGETYYLSFDEWFAQQTARYMVDKQKGVPKGSPGIVGRFFQKLASILLKYYNIAFKKGFKKSDFAPASPVAGYLNTLEGNTLAAQPLYSSVWQSAPKTPLAPEIKQTATVTEEQLKNMMQQLGVDSSTLDNLQMDRYNSWIGKTWTLLQLVEKNQHIPGLIKYKETVETWHKDKMSWISRADGRLREWSNLSKAESEILSKALFELSNMEKQPTAEELVALVQGNERVMKMLLNIQNDFRAVLDYIQDIRVDNALGMGENPAPIIAEMQLMKKQPYFPHTWFGQFMTVVKDKETGKIVHMEAYEIEGQRNSEVHRIMRAYPKDKYTVWRTRMSEESLMYRGIPPGLLRKIRSELSLTPQQQEEFDLLEYALAPARSFKHHLQKRSGTEGYSVDAMRTYGDYFLKAANHLARMKYSDSLQLAINEVGRTIGKLKNLGEGIKLDTRVRIHDHLKRHYEYIMNPKNELQALKKLAFHWYLGFNVKSAVINLTQIPMVAYPFLSAHFGDVQTARALSRAGSNLKRLYSGKTEMVDPSLYRALTLGVQEGFLDESQAMELAGFAEGNFLQRMLPKTGAGRTIRNIEYASAYLFQLAENYNRRVVFRAGYELALKNPEAGYCVEVRKRNPELLRRMIEEGWSINEATAFLVGKQTVQGTQYEYGNWNRSEIFRGKKGVLGVFLTFMQQQMWFFRHQKGGVKALMLLLAAAGIMGMPGAEDLSDLVQALARALGEEFDPERELRELLVYLGSERPDFWLNGASRYGFGLPQVAEAVGIPWVPRLDLSGSMGMGRLVPGLEPLLAQNEFDSKVSQTMTNVAGAAVSIPLAIAQSLYDDNPDWHKRLERGMPTAMRNVSKMYRYWEQGNENVKGVRIHEFDRSDWRDSMEILATGAGFQLRPITQQYDQIAMRKEAEMFWTLRRDRLLDMYAYLRRVNDTEEIKEFWDRVRDYNDSVPYASLKMSPKTIQRSWKAREVSRRYLEQGIPPRKMYRQMNQDIRQIFPEVIVEDVPSR